MITCPNCGAQIDNDTVKCPHCGFINIEGSEKKYFNELNEIKDKLEEVEKEPVKALKKGLSKGAKVVITTVIVIVTIVVLYAILVSFSIRNHPRMFLNAQQQAMAAAYKVAAGEQLQEAYDNKDIEQLAYIYDKAYSEDRVSLWGDPHYETGYAASNYVKLWQSLPSLESKHLSVRQAEEITYDCFYFYYRAYGEDGAVIFDDIRDDEIMPILIDRLGYSIEEMEGLRDKVTESSRVVRSRIYRVTKKHMKNYK